MFLKKWKNQRKSSPDLNIIQGFTCRFVCNEIFIIYYIVYFSLDFVHFSIEFHLFRLKTKIISRSHCPRPKKSERKWSILHILFDWIKWCSTWMKFHYIKTYVIYEMNVANMLFQTMDTFSSSIFRPVQKFHYENCERMSIHSVWLNTFLTFSVSRK